MTPKPVIENQYVTAQVYFGCVVGMLLVEALLKLPSHIRSLTHQGRPFTKSTTKHNKLYIICHKLVTLPSFVPFLTSHNLPNYLRFAVFAGLNILFGYNRVKFTTDYKLYGWLTIANGGLAFLMAARSNLFSVILRIPSSTLLLYHRWIGLATVIHATLHFGWTAAHNIRAKQLAQVLNTLVTQAGLVAWVALAIIFITSLRPVRRRWFEGFYYPHFFFLVFAIGGMIHATHGPEFFMPGVGLWVIDRAIRFYYNFRKIEVLDMRHYIGGVTKLRVKGLTVSRPGQMAWVQIPSISFLNWHPFTIASAPGDEVVTFAIRGLGGYTKRVQHLDSSASTELGIAPQSLRMRIDGPYGMGKISWGQHPVTVLVAGGIGITPGISIATHIIRRAVATPMVSENDKWHIHLLWVVKEPQHAMWFEEELTLLGNTAAESRGRATFDVTIYATKGGDRAKGGEISQEEQDLEDDSYSYKGPGVILKGRPDTLNWFANVRDSRKGMDVAVNLCGPRSLIDDSRQVASKLSWEGGLFDVEEEVFEF